METYRLMPAQAPTFAPNRKITAEKLIELAQYELQDALNMFDVEDARNWDDDQAAEFKALEYQWALFEELGSVHVLPPVIGWTIDGKTTLCTSI